MKKILGLFLILMLCVSGQVQAAVVTASPDSSDIVEINRMTPGSDKTFLGTRLRGLLQKGTTTVSSSDSALDTSYALHVVTTPVAAAGGISPTLGNGYPNQLLTVVLGTDGGATLTITPTTKTGFTSVTWQDAGDSATFRYVDDTYGWVLENTKGVKVVHSNEALGAIAVDATATGYTTAIDTDYDVQRFTTGAFSGANPSLGAGRVGQLMTVVLETDGGQNLIVTPTTKIGFTSFTLDSANDAISLRYVDDVVGWVIVGENSATVN